MCRYIPALILSLLIAGLASADEDQRSFRATLAEAVVTEDAEQQILLVESLIGADDEFIGRILTAWRVSEVFVHEDEEGNRVPFILNAQQNSDGESKGVRIDNGQFVLDADGNELFFSSWQLVPADTTSDLRRTMRTVLDLIAMGNS